MASRWLLRGGAGIMLATCASPPPLPQAGPVASTIVVVERGWHTDICLRGEDADAWIATLARGFEGARFLCFGFGERQYVVSREHGLLTMLSALLPSPSALLMTALRDTPAAAFGPANAVGLGVSRAGLAGVRAFLRRSTQTDATGQPMRLGEGPYPGSEFFAATGTYDGLYTCNTWTADALRAGGLPADDAVLFADDLMRQVRRLATAQGGGAS
jgi:uncharacterized protein (TIGR02117 family)